MRLCANNLGECMLIPGVGYVEARAAGAFMPGFAGASKSADAFRGGMSNESLPSPHTPATKGSPAFTPPPSFVKKFS